MKISTFMVGFLIFGFFITAGAVVMGDLSSTYGTDEVENLEVYGKFNESYKLSQNITESIRGKEFSGSDKLSSLTATLFGSIIMPLTSIGTFYSMLVGVAGVIHLPVLVINLILGVLMILVSFAIAGAFFNKEI